MDRREEIRELLSTYVKRAGSQAKAAAKMGIAASTINAALSGNKDDKVSDEMWRIIEGYVRISKADEEWICVETRAYQEITQVLRDAHRHQQMTWLVSDAGSGKSTTARLYERNNCQVYYVLCSEDMLRGDFLREVMRALGRKSTGNNSREMLMEVIEVLKSEKAPLLILDEADKLLDSILLYLVTIYNHLEERAGIVLLSTDYIEHRMARGLRLQKRGYNELYSRIGRRFYRVESASIDDVAAICSHNGIRDEATAQAVMMEASRYRNDLRRVKKVILSRRRV